jgi:hypothetical protein
VRTNVAPGVFTIVGVLTPDECREYIDWSEGQGYELAPVSLTRLRGDEILGLLTAFLCAWPDDVAVLGQPRLYEAARAGEVASA